MFYGQPQRRTSIGLYYDGKKNGVWKISNHDALDRSFPIDIFSDPTLTEDDILDRMQAPHRLARRNRQTVQVVDTPMETADKSLMASFWHTVYRSLKSERVYLQEDKKLEIKNKITTYIEQHSDGEYLYLPYNLQVESIKAGLGNCQDTLLSYQNGKITSLTTASHVQNQINFVEEQKVSARPYDLLDDADKNTLDTELLKYTQPIDGVLLKLTNLLTVRGRLGAQDPLHIPAEYKDIVNQKISDWEQFKHSLYDYQPSEAKSMVINAYQSYYHQFLNLYMGMLGNLDVNALSSQLQSVSKMSTSLNYGGGIM